MRIERLYGPGLPAMAWLNVLSHQFNAVSIVRDCDLQALEQENAVLEERLRSMDKAREFWHGEYMLLADALPFTCCASSPGSSSPTTDEDLPSS